MFYFIKTPAWLKKIYPSCTWQIKTSEKIIYLTFDDGPHPIATPFVLEVLKDYEASATFFCVGSNVAKHPEIYQRIIEEGHAVGNHTFDHLNGWKTKNDLYIDNIEKARNIIGSNLFRPPYGKITFKQLRLLSRQPKPLKVIMWSVLSGDFDVHVSKEECFKNVIRNTGNGSIIVFHDSQKALGKLQAALPVILTYFALQGYKFEKITV